MTRLIFAILGLASAASSFAQQAPTTPSTARTLAPTDFTGYWVAVVTEDWRWRMMTPLKGDVSSIPVNAEGRRAAEAWDPAKDVAAGEQCRAYGAAGIMRMPVRLHVTWQDENTLKVDIDNGTQTRLLHFDANAKPPAAPEWQGFSLAKWESAAEGQGQAPFAGGQAGGQNALGGNNLSGSIRITTTYMRPGYLRRNGVPYGANAVLTEFLDRTSEPNGDSWLVLTSIVEDPQYLQIPLMLTTDRSSVHARVRSRRPSQLSGNGSSAFNPPLRRQTCTQAPRP
jgi:hypothetical protein